LSPGARSKTGSRPAEKKAQQHVSKEYLEEVLGDFSGYVAIDELYDGPFCVLFIVDNHKFRRLIYEVLDHDPTHQDITRFLRRFQKELDSRGLTLKGVTTDGSQLYPTPLEEVFGKVSHQLCEFHVLKEIIKEILKAVAAARRELKNQQPKLKRGRPSSKAAKKAAGKKQRLQEKIAELFAYRHLFVKRSLTPKEKIKMWIICFFDKFSIEIRIINIIV